MNSDTRWSAQELRDALTRYEEELRAAGKARNTVNTYVQHPERFINWLEGRYVPVQSGPNWGRGTSAQDAGLRLNSTGPPRYGPASFTPDPPPAGPGVSAGSSRYDPLGWYLAERQEAVVHLSFVAIERIIGAPLPDSARRHRPWWANERAGNHVHAKAWMVASRRTANVNLNAGTVDFVR